MRSGKFDKLDVLPIANGTEIPAVVVLKKEAQPDFFKDKTFKQFQANFALALKDSKKYTSPGKGRVQHVVEGEGDAAGDTMVADVLDWMRTALPGDRRPEENNPVTKGSKALNTVYIEAVNHVVAAASTRFTIAAAPMVVLRLNGLARYVTEELKTLDPDGKLNYEDLATKLLESEYASAIKVNPLEMIFFPAGLMIREVIEEDGVMLRIAGKPIASEKEKMEAVHRLLGEKERQESQKILTLLP